MGLRVNLQDEVFKFSSPAVAMLTIICALELLQKASLLVKNAGVLQITGLRLMLF